MLSLITTSGKMLAIGTIPYRKWHHIFLSLALWQGIALERQLYGVGKGCVTKHMPSSGAQHSQLPVTVTAINKIILRCTVQKQPSLNGQGQDSQTTFSRLLQATKTQFSIPYASRAVSKLVVNILCFLGHTASVITAQLLNCVKSVKAATDNT